MLVAFTLFAFLVLGGLGLILIELKALSEDLDALIMYNKILVSIASETRTVMQRIEHNPDVPAQTVFAGMSTHGQSNL